MVDTESKVDAPAAEAMPAQTGSNFDVVDTPDEIEASPGPLRELLEAWVPHVSYFCEVDARAVVEQRWHVRVIWGAAGVGTAVVLFAILELYLRLELIGLLELAAAVALVLVLLAGWWAANNPRWLHDRFRAEAFRRAKFHHLLGRGHLYEASEAGPVAKTPAEVVDELRRCPANTPRAWSHGETFVGEYQRVREAEPPTAEFADAVTAYYLEKRLDYQDGYFEKESERRHKREEWLHRFGHACLVGSLVVTFIKHSAKGVTIGLGEDPHHLEVLGITVESFAYFLLFLAAFLPVMGAGIRTVRGAREYGRNRNRYLAVHRRLTRFRDQLARAERPADKLELLWEVEEELAIEHRAWLRLMTAAEWLP